jgi:hypothetical protein
VQPQPSRYLPIEANFKAVIIYYGLGQLTPKCDNVDIYGDTKIFKPLMTKTYKNSISWKEND